MLKAVAIKKSLKFSQVSTAWVDSDDNREISSFFEGSFKLISTVKIKFLKDYVYIVRSKDHACN